MLFGGKRLFLAGGFPLLGRTPIHTGPLAVDRCRTQKVVAVLISLLGKSNQCKSSFFIWIRGLLPLLLCFLFTKTSKVLRSSEVEWEHWTVWSQRRWGIRNGTFESGLKESRQVFLTSVTDTFFFLYMKTYKKKIWEKNNSLYWNVYHL